MEDCEQGGIEPGKVVLGMRAGFAPVTQTFRQVLRLMSAPWSISSHV